MYKHILLAIDLQRNPVQDKAVGVAIEIAQTFEAQLHVMTVIPGIGSPSAGSYFPDNFESKSIAAAKEELHAFTASMFPKNIKVRHVIAEGTVYERVIHSAEKTGADLIIMGAQRPELKDYLLGPNSSRVVRHAECSVLVVRNNQPG